MPFFKRRMYEYWLSMIISSIVVTALFTGGVFVSNKLSFVVGMIFVIAGNLIYQYYCLNSYLCYVEDYGTYFKTNILVFLTHGVAATVSAFLNYEPYYTYLFMPYKLFVYFGVSKAVSAIFVSLIMILFIFFIPYKEYRSKRKIQKNLLK